MIAAVRVSGVHGGHDAIRERAVRTRERECRGARLRCTATTSSRVDAMIGGASGIEASNRIASTAAFASPPEARMCSGSPGMARHAASASTRSRPRLVEGRSSLPSSTQSPPRSP